MVRGCFYGEHVHSCDVDNSCIVDPPMSSSKTMARVVHDARTIQTDLLLSPISWSYHITMKDAVIVTSINAVEEKYHDVS